MTNKNNKTWNMKLFGLLIVVIVMFIFTLNNVHALGVAPSREVINYDTDEHTLTARIINNEHKDMNILLYPQGDLAKYVLLEQNSFSIKSTDAEVSFTYKVKLPENLEPGTKDITIAVMEFAEEDAANPEMIASSIIVLHQLRINVPYPGTFAEGILYVSEDNTDSTITFTTNVINKGTNTLTNVDGELIIKGPANEEICRIRSNSLQNLDPQSSDKLVVNWPANVNPGVYYAEFIVNYGDGKETKQFVMTKTIDGIDLTKKQDAAGLGNVIASMGGNSITSILIILLLVLAAINIGWFVYLKFLKKNE